MANKHKGSGFTKSAQGSSLTGQQKAAQRAMQEAAAKERARKERAARKNAVKAIPATDVKTAIEILYLQANPSMGMFAYGESGHYGYKADDGSILILNTIRRGEKSVVYVVDSTVPGIVPHEHFYLKHGSLLYDHPEQKNSGNLAEWQAHLHQFLRPIVRQTYMEAVTERAAAKVVPARMPQTSHAPQFGQRDHRGGPAEKLATNVIELHPALNLETLPLGRILSGTEGLYDFSTGNHTLICNMKKCPRGNYLVVKKLSKDHPLATALIESSVVHVVGMEEKYPELYTLIQGLLACVGINVVKIKTTKHVQESTPAYTGTSTRTPQLSA